MNSKSPAIVGVRGAAEVVDRHGVDAALGEAQRQLLVERMQSADIGQDDDARAGGVSARASKARNCVAVGRLELDPLAVDGCAGKRRNRWVAVKVEAHCGMLSRDARLGSLDSDREE